ncbi:kinesin-like protein KIF6 isoform X2 [Vespula pensylvanica]|uniref:kinesin-like protein KIF6 isoform X2 n=1 Tax=Vespula pensylvanica TaxID=30213 RepID=UPI001CBA50F0|nr:kinesin-like protein KIF6 isoform X2 [Vespula pensylvanica]
MGRDVIKVFARLKPEANRENLTKYRILRRPKDHSKEDFLVLLAPFKDDEYVDHRPESWKFSFYRIIEEEANQQDVFEDVGRPVIESVLDGYNGTVFAYGQTGSGKTYTITGKVSSSNSQGIVPRTLSYLFDVIKMHPENVYSVDVAYLEIYNEYGYDLLDRKQQQQQQQQQVQQAMRLEDLPRVSIQEDEKGKLRLKNLTFHNVKSEDQAMELFLIGDSRRVTADTPTNPQSSRSHCIFTIVVSIKQLGANRYKRAKMHLVDLAGSERVYKCAISGTVLSEAKHINLSLHYLEQVIVCLNQENSSHIPYRKGRETNQNRFYDRQETISTCRFAQRVALVRNDARLMLEHDLNSENTLLKLENEKLRKQIEELIKQNENFKSMLSLRENRNDFEKRLDYYKNLVTQRDQEISVLLGSLRKARDKKNRVEVDSNDVEVRSKSKAKAKESTAERLSKTTKLLEVIKKSELGNGMELKETDSDALCKPEMNLSQRKFVEEGEIEKSKIERNVENEDIARNGENERVSSKKRISLKKSLGSNGGVEIDPCKDNRSKLEEGSETKRIDKSLHDDSIYSANLSSNRAMTNKFPDLIINDALVNCPVAMTNDRLETQRLQKIIMCNKVDNDFEKNLPLTGDPEIDEEIIAFYKAKRSGGIY